MERKELIALAKENGVKKAHQTKTVELETILTEMGVIGNKVEKRGRPVNPNSERQKRLAEMKAKAEANGGEIPKGRPVDPTSERQKRLAELEEKRANGELKRGRPSNPNSARQKRLAELEAKKAANGGVIPRGRPKKVEEEVEENKEANS